MSPRIVVIVLYVLFGVIYLAAGASVVSVNSGFLPADLRRLVLSLVHGDAGTLHIAQEFGTHMIILGIVTLWFAKNYERSGWFHLAMTIGWGLFALIHWDDVRNYASYKWGPILNTLPFVLFAGTGLWRRRIS